MYTLCWSVKGGSGTTVVSCALAISSARGRPTVLVDLGGDVPAALGIAEPAGPGVGDWLSSPHASAESLGRLAVEVATDLHVVPSGGVEFDVLEPLHAERLAHACSVDDLAVVIDAGPHARHQVLHAAADRSLLVVRPCYLALRRAVQRPPLATGVVVVHEPGRGLGVSDVERAVGVPVTAEIAWDPGVARAVDAGVFVARPPSSLIKVLGRSDRAVLR